MGKQLKEERNTKKRKEEGEVVKQEERNIKEAESAGAESRWQMATARESPRIL